MRPPREDTLPWYKQFWPWFLIALPASVVVAGLTTWGIAARHADDLVADDYYKSGLSINRDLAMLEQAQALGLQGELTIDDNQVIVSLRGTATPAALRLHLSHPLEADWDRVVNLPRSRPGTYSTALDLPTGQRWLWSIEPLPLPADAPWRLDGEVVP